MHVCVDDVNFCDGLEYVYAKYKSRASTAHGLPDYYMGFSRLKWQLIVCDMAFYAIIRIISVLLVLRTFKRGW